MKTIKNSVVNTFNRVGIPFESLMARDNEVVTVSNRFGGGSDESHDQSVEITAQGD